MTDPQTIASKLTADDAAVMIMLSAEPSTIMAAAYRTGADATANMIDLVAAAQRRVDLVDQVASNPHMFRLNADGLAVRTHLEKESKT